MSVLLASLADSAICFVPDLAEPLDGHSATTNRTILRDRVDLVGDDCGTHSLGAWLGGGWSYVTALSHAFGLRRDRRWSKYRSKVPRTEAPWNNSFRLSSTPKGQGTFRAVPS
jgi:hypothetical protein